MWPKIPCHWPPNPQRVLHTHNFDHLVHDQLHFIYLVSCNFKRIGIFHTIQISPCKSFFPSGLEHVSPFLSNLPKKAQITFRRVFLKDCTTILLLTSFLFTFQFASNAFEVVRKARCRCLVVSPLNHSFFPPIL